MNQELNKVVAPCLTADDLVAIQTVSQSDDVEVIAVALDLGDGAGLRELHDAARAAGATRCHALDLREEFARACVLPVIDADTIGDGVAELEARTREFVAKKLASIGLLEGDAVVLPASRLPVAPATRKSPAAPDRSATLNIAFDAGVPVSVNDIPMSLAELLDSLGTIGAAHGLDRPAAAIGALHAALRALRSNAPGPSGSARLEISRRGISVHPECSTP